MDPNFIVMGSQSKYSFVIHCNDFKQLSISSREFLDTEIFGVSWDPSTRDEYIVGCMDGTVRRCNMN